MSYIKNSLLALAAALLISGCSSGGGAGSATITAENARDLAVAGTEATKEASTSSDFMPYKSGSSSLDAKTIAKMVTQDLYATEDLSPLLCTGGGTYIFEYPDDPNATTGTVSFTFTDCVYSDIYETVTINGSIIITVSSSSASFSGNLSITDNNTSATETMSFSGTCAVSGSTVGTCTYASSFTGVDGRTYSMANISVSGNDFSGYTVSGSVTDPDHGVITISTPQPVTFNCAGGYPDSGQIVIEGSNGSATVTYNSCTSFTVTFDGVGTIYNWADI